ncbi:AMP-binding protein [Roseimicrobium sp. ORNL1]|nr:AMP-binding protein [Roseimicrobium sp. ORNL1]
MRWKQWRGRARVKVATHALYRDFPKEGTEGNVWQRFESIVQAHANRPAVSGEKGVLTYRQLWKQARAIQRALGPPGPPVALLLRHEASMIAPILGAVAAGRPYVFLNPSLPVERLRFMLEDSGAKTLITKDTMQVADTLTGPDIVRLDVADMIQAAKDASEDETNANAVPIQAGAPLCMNYTSGTTSTPSGVVRSHRALLVNIRNMTRLGKISPADRLTCLISPTFGAAMMDIFGALLNGACLHIYDVRGSGLEKLPDWIEANEITFYHSVPTLFRSFVSAVKDASTLRSMRFVLLGGEQVFASDLDAFQRLFPRGAVFQNVLGMTEGAGILCSYLADHGTPNTENRVPVGYPVDEKQIWIADEHGAQLPFGEPGEIVVQSRALSTGYINREEATRRKFREAADGSGDCLLFTGDLGRIRPDDGALVWLGRKDLQAKVGGIRISPAEVEAELLKLPSIRAAAVTVVTSGENKQAQILAWVIARENSFLDPDALRRELQNELPGDAMPGRFIQLDSLPVLPNGKVDRNSLTLDHPAVKRGANLFPVAPRTDTERTVAAAFARTLNVERVGAYDHFFELGGDSLGAINVLGTLSTTYGFELPTVALLHHPTVAVLAEMIPIWAAQATSAGTSFGGQALPAKNLSIVTMRTQGTRAPIFICPGGHGSENELLVFAKMLVMLDLDRPIHGLRLSAFTDRYRDMHSLTAAAAEIGEQLLSAHPHGAFILMGECGSGVLAAEIARWIEQVAPDRMPEKIILLDSRTNEHRLAHGTRFENADELLQPHMKDFFRLLLTWETPQVNFPMELINSEGFLSEGNDPSLGWQKLSRHPLPVHRIPGDHFSYIREHADKVASVIHKMLDTNEAAAASVSGNSGDLDRAG